MSGSLQTWGGIQHPAIAIINSYINLSLSICVCAMDVISHTRDWAKIREMSSYMSTVRILYILTSR